MKIVVTGASGFIGRHLCLALTSSGHFVTTISRKTLSQSQTNNQINLIADLESEVNYEGFLQGCDVVIHLAGLAHQVHGTTYDSSYISSNEIATLNLAKASEQNGVKRFVFVSSIKVNGESTPIGSPFTTFSTPNPSDAYGRSKLAAERGLMQIANSTSLEVTIIRPPLVYGPGVRANFQDLISFVGKQIPLPLGRVRNKRSLIGVGNLVSLITKCIDHPGAINQTFLASDISDLSTPELIRQIAKSQNRRAYLLPVPMYLLRFGAKMLRKEHQMNRLCDSLQVDVSSTIEKLGWVPPFTTAEGINQTVNFWMTAKNE